VTFAPVVLSLPTADRVRAFAFYTTGLGLEGIGPLADDGVPEPCRLVVNDGLHLMLVPTGGFGWTLSGRPVADAGSHECLVALDLAGAEEVDALFARAVAAGGAVVSSPQQQPWGYVGTLTDPDGHLWMLRTG
jgi:hypothetical protein